jgi:hypothetical protein
MAMKRFLAFLIAAVLLAGLGVGCGDSKDKGINSNRDKPTADH